MVLSVSPKDEIWFLRVCHHISNAVYHSAQPFCQNAHGLVSSYVPLSRWSKTLKSPTGWFRVWWTKGQWSHKAFLEWTGWSWMEGLTIRVIWENILKKSEADIRPSCEEPIYRDIQRSVNAETRIQNITQWSEETATSAKKVRKNLFLCKQWRHIKKQWRYSSTHSERRH